MICTLCFNFEAAAYPPFRSNALLHPLSCSGAVYLDNGFGSTENNPYNCTYTCACSRSYSFGGMPLNQVTFSPLCLSPALDWGRRPQHEQSHFKSVAFFFDSNMATYCTSLPFRWYLDTGSSVSLFLVPAACSAYAVSEIGMRVSTLHPV